MMYHEGRLNSLVLQLSAWCAAQKTWDLNGCPLLCMFFAKDFSGHLLW